MNRTNNYNLCQFEESDRVRCTDFNEDNAKIDGALAGIRSALTEEVNARGALDAALRPKAGVQTIASFTLSREQSSAYVISTAGIDWNDWLAIFISVELVVPTGTYGDTRLYINDFQAGDLFLNSISSKPEERTAMTFMITPLYDKRNWVRVWPMTITDPTFPTRWLSLRFKDITKFKISSGGALAAGTSYTIRGIR